MVDANTQNASKGLKGLTFGVQSVKTGAEKSNLSLSLDKLFDTKGVKESERSYALGVLMHALNMTSTSSKLSVEPDATMVSAMLPQNTVFKVTFGEFNNWLSEQPELKGAQNKARVFARSMCDDYVEFLRDNHHDLPQIPRANKHGISSAHSYMAADFYTSNKSLSELEQAVHLEGSVRALKTNGAANTEVTNLFQLGRKL